MSASDSDADDSGASDSGEARASKNNENREHPKIYSEDLVALISHPEKKGVVQAVAWEASDDDDEVPLPDNTVEVSWLDSFDEIEELDADELVVLDRALLHGDVVTRINDPQGRTAKQGQSGYVVECHISVTLRLQNDASTILQKVPARILTQVDLVSGFRPDSCIIYRGWLGAIVGNRSVNVSVQFDNGKRAVVPNVMTRSDLTLTGTDEDDEDDEEDAKANFKVGERCTLAPHAIQALRFADAPPAPANVPLTQIFRNRKARRCTITEIQPAELFVKWVMGDGKDNSNEPPPESIPADQFESIIRLDNFAYTHLGLNDLVLIKDESGGFAAYNNQRAVIIDIRNICDVLWQDGTESFDVPSPELIPLNDTLDTDYWPEDYVVRSDDSANEHVGVVVRANAAQCTATVRWLDRPAEDPPEELSIYNIRNHPDMRFFLGCVVARLPGTESTGWNAFEASVGEVCTQRNGRLELICGDGSRVWVAPSEVIMFDIDSLLEQNEDDEDDYDEEEIIDSDAENAEYSEVEEHNESEQQSPHNQNVENEHPEAPERQSSAVAASADVGATPGDTDFVQFAVLEVYPSAHQHLSSPVRKEARLNDRQWLTGVKREWTMLQKDLPPGIYVRTFESCTDLFTALIIGPPGTPYIDCLFVFDILLPPSYPNVPPLVHYRSPVSEKFNPNLYETGRVCLSLLGTWSGKGSENWNPQTSSLLQLLVSLQGLILISEPYYLEAGYESHRGTLTGARASRLYNEHAMLLSLQSMLVHGTQPSPFFTRIILKHLAASQAKILARCQNYLDKYLPTAPSPAPAVGKNPAPSRHPAITREGDQPDAGTPADPLDECGLVLPPSLGFLKALQALMLKIKPVSPS